MIVLNLQREGKKVMDLLMGVASLLRVKEKGSVVSCEYLMPQYPFATLMQIA